MSVRCCITNLSCSTCMFQVIDRASVHVSGIKTLNFKSGGCLSRKVVDVHFVTPCVIY